MEEKHITSDKLTKIQNEPRKLKASNLPASMFSIQENYQNMNGIQGGSERGFRDLSEIHLWNPKNFHI
jgi:hypothetical protein